MSQSSQIHLPRKFFFHFLQLKLFKNDKKYFLFHAFSLLLFYFLRYFYFSPDFLVLVFGYVKMHLNNKAKDNLKIDDATDWTYIYTYIHI